MDATAKRILMNLDEPANLEAEVQYALMRSNGGAISAAQARAALWREDINDPIYVELARRVRTWDAVENVGWVASTASLTTERRVLAYELLGLDEAERQWCNERIPVFKGEPAVVIAEHHDVWYTQERRTKCSFYWNGLSGHLQQQGWDGDSLASLDVSTTRVVERLSDPCREQAHKTKGLVVGYVQSGKTANFTGVIAKAADAGYRLIIVLGGTWNILREQTQRRLDKEMIGVELLGTDYDQEPEAERAKFLRHGKMPSVLGYFDWQRLTGPGDDYKLLKKGQHVLAFRSAHPGLPFCSWENLAHEPARLIVLKKNKSVVDRLIKDLKESERRGGAGAVPLSAVPMLLIDDESDQAGVNTRPPNAAQQRDRTAVNGAITRLLGMFPRGQYVGYTATPFANVFIDPDDAEDLFPKDYLVCLPRPAGYMGIRDFHDLDGAPNQPGPNELALVRDIVGADGEEGNLPRAIDAFVLTGAIKLWRETKEPALGKRYRHHTMLIHTDVSNATQDALASQVKDVFDDGTYDQAAALLRLEKLWQQDFQPVCADRAGDLPVPGSFAELKEYIGKTAAQIEHGGSVVLVVNGDPAHKEESPDFDHQRVWKIILGGNKLSRGYTVEGLTISYYRRKANTADTLMQMGRWFGFRRGYQDLVRVFLGRQEPSSRRIGAPPIDLYRWFEATCRDEEAFRADIKKYAEKLGHGRIRPIDVPPLVPQHLRLLRPTQNNKMFNAIIDRQNFSEDYLEPTMAPAASSKEAGRNLRRAADLLGRLGLTTVSLGVDGASFKALIGKATPEDVASFLADYEFSEKNDRIVRLVRFLRKEDGQGSPEIDQWLVMVPQIASTVGQWRVGGLDLAVAKRARIGGEDTRFGVYSDPKHRQVGLFLAGIAPPMPQPPVIPSPQWQPVGDTLNWRAPRTAVLLVYPVKQQQTDQVTIGFAAIIPRNSIQTPIVFSVRVAAKPNAVVVGAVPTP